VLIKSQEYSEYAHPLYIVQQNFDQTLVEKNLQSFVEKNLQLYLYPYLVQTLVQRLSLVQN
jgi:hypothetical protein